ncbi:programmed cell death protein 2-like [Venturia canescens]|uniref:programmed cell death protein 2-like n=1 Tax=Venturia canescens TaxID=32260 RepID=UPI001C9BF7DD|nr:programmed cell death protein 2-like [Venturia canescens]
MARKNRSKVYLGYEDEFITEKHRSLVNFTTNKIGGKPDPHEESSVPTPQCKLCALRQILAMQMYAPLENSIYHRTIYIFACINPNCWNENESWTCLRVQSLERKTITTNTCAVDNCGGSSTTSWLSEEDDWGEDTTNDNASEKNGNNIMGKAAIDTSDDRIDERDLDREVSNLRLDDPNANSPTSIDHSLGGIGTGGGAVGRLDTAHASAEIEGEESEVVCIDTPTQPQCDLMDLLREVTPLPLQHSEPKIRVNLSFAEIFMSVEEEDLGNRDVSQHVRDLFLEYQSSNPDVPVCSETNFDHDVREADVDASHEKYEKSVPVHGDEMFHYFLSRIQKNPGQIVRYCRDNKAALPVSPFNESVGTCQHCGAERIFEIQILPTIIPKLRLLPSNGSNFQIEFGTILVFTCSRSCWSPHDLYKEEHVVVQPERL